jgi:hypothetical protein
VLIKNGVLCKPLPSPSPDLEAVHHGGGSLVKAAGMAGRSVSPGHPGTPGLGLDKGVPVVHCAEGWARASLGRGGPLPEPEPGSFSSVRLCGWGPSTARWLNLSLTDYATGGCCLEPSAPPAANRGALST